MRNDHRFRLRPAAALPLVLGAVPAVAGTTCNFNIECYMTEPCEGSGWELVVDPEAEALSTVFGDLDILHADTGGAQIVARGDGALYLLTIGERLSVFTTHVAGDATTITYVGECMSE